jgi:hypothetical protein
MNQFTSSLKLLLIIFILLSIYSCGGGGETLHHDPIPPDTLIIKKVDSLNKRLTYLKISKFNEVSFLGETKHDPVLRFRVTNKTKDSVSGVYFFKINKYTNLIMKDPTNYFTDEICAVLESLSSHKKSNTVLQAIKSLKIQAETTFFKALKVEITNLEKILFELIYALYEIKKIEAKNIKILVRGYADKAGSNTFPIDTLDKKYNYKTIVIKPIKVGRRGKIPYFKYQKKDTIINIGDTNNRYNNLELPNLRAEFIRKEIIQQTIDTSICNVGKATLDVEVLEGHTFDDKVDSVLRKVDIFIHFYYDKMPKK